MRSRSDFGSDILCNGSDILISSATSAIKYILKIQRKVDRSCCLEQNQLRSSRNRRSSQLDVNFHFPQIFVFSRTQLTIGQGEKETKNSYEPFPAFGCRRMGQPLGNSREVETRYCPMVITGESVSSGDKQLLVVLLWNSIYASMYHTRCNSQGLSKVVSRLGNSQPPRTSFRRKNKNVDHGRKPAVVGGNNVSGPKTRRWRQRARTTTATKARRWGTKGKARTTTGASFSDRQQQKVLRESISTKRPFPVSCNKQAVKYAIVINLRHTEWK